MSRSFTSLPNQGPRSRPIIIGREREKTFLRECVDDMRSGQGSFVLVSGQAGIGKSTLVEWLAREAEEAECLVLRGGCYDLTTTPPYGPWLELVQDYRSSTVEPLLPAFLDDPLALEQVGSQEALFAGIVDFLASIAAARPTLLILEDLHWADPASVSLLRFVGRQIGRHRLLLVATHRSDDLSRQHPLYTFLPIIVREAAAERLDVRPFTGDESQALIRALYPLPQADQIRLEQYVETRSEGNPLYANELLRTLEDEGFLKPRDDGVWQLEDPERLRVPRFVLQVIEQRLGRLDVETRQLLQIAAVIGDVVPIDVWQQVSQSSTDLLVATIQHGQSAWVIEEASTNDSYRFRHGLLRQALYEEAVAPQRRLWHRRVAEVLETLPRPDPDALAYHYQQAGDVRAASWLMRAGERAERAYAWLTSADRFEAAMSILDEQGEAASTRALLRARIANLRRYVDPNRAVLLLREAVQLAVDAGEAGLACHCQFTLGLLQCFENELREGLTRLKQAVLEYRLLPDSEKTRISKLPYAGAGSLEGRLVPWLVTAGQLKEAIEIGERVTSEMPASGSSMGQGASPFADAIYGLAMAHSLLGQPYRARQEFQKARAIYQSINHHAVVATSYVHELQEVQLPYFSEDVATRTQLTVLGEDFARKASGAVPGDMASRYISLDLLILDGKWHEAREVAATAYRTGHGPVWLHGCRCLSWLAYAQGDIELAQQIIRRVHPQGPATEIGDIFLLTGMLMQRLAAEIALDRHDASTARLWLEAHDRWLASSEAVLGRADGELCWALYHLERGELDLARTRAEAALAYASEPRQPLVLIAIQRLLGQLDISESRFEEAEGRLDESLTLADSCAVPFERALTLLALAELRLAQGRAEETRVALDDVRAICEPIEAKPTIAKMEHLLERAGVLTRTATVYPAGLTAREVEVLRLVAQGMTDGEVADQLFLSPRTVSAHLRSVYNKIGVGSRAAATRFAVEHDLI